MSRVTIWTESIGDCAGAGEASKQSAKNVFRMAMKVHKSRSFAPAALRMAGAVLLSERAERARSEGSAYLPGRKFTGNVISQQTARRWTRAGRKRVRSTKSLAA